MKVCPNCGYEDKECWKHSRYGYDKQIDYCNIEELKTFEPDIFKSLILNKEYDDGLYYYRLTKRGYVYRILSKFGYKSFYQRGYTEKPKLESKLKLDDFFK